MTFLEVADGHWIVAEDVIAVKRISKKKCCVWLKGQSAEGGFVVDEKAEILLEEICAACCEDEVEPEDDEDEE